MHWMKKIAMWLLVVSGLAWGYEGLMDKNIFDLLGGNGSYAVMGIEVLMGLSALLVAFKMLTCKKHCEGGHHE